MRPRVGQRGWIFLFISLLLVQAACTRSPVQRRPSRISSSQLQAVVDEYLKDKPNILATTVKVEIGGTGAAYEAASGFIDSSRSVPVDPNTRFIIGSVTKVFTAVLVLQLVEHGQVRLQDRLIEHLPPDWSAMLETIPDAGDITVEQTLAHRTGIPDVTNSDAFVESLYFDSAAAVRPVDVVRRVQEIGELNFTPGEDFDYCNVNYILLGGLIEHVSGRSYRQALHENILNRIGLQNTSLVGTTYGSFGDTIAYGYETRDGVSYDGRRVRVEWAHAAGGIVSTAGDLVTFYLALASGALFGDPDTYAQMHQLVGFNETYGLGLEVVNAPDLGLYYGHRGHFMGSRTILAHLPHEQLTIAVCQTYLGFSMAYPLDLMKLIVQRMRGETPGSHASPQFEGPDILADSSNLIVNSDTPARGEWDFAPTEVWRVGASGDLSLPTIGDIHVDHDGSLYLLDRGSARIVVLDSGGNLLRSFGGFGDGPRLENPLSLFVTPGFVQVLDLGRSGDRIKRYDKHGNYVDTYEVEPGVSPRAFVDDDRYVAVRSGPDPLNRPSHELLEIVSLQRASGSVVTRFPAEDKLTLEVMVPRGRTLLLEDDVDIFPRLITHVDGDMLFLGRSDQYVIKKTDLEGAERLAFAVAGRERERLPQDYAVQLAASTRVLGAPLPKDAAERFVAQFPEEQVYYTNVTTDEQGRVYVFLPEVRGAGTQKIDVFSPDGRYVYRATMELPNAMTRIRPLALRGGHVYALVADGEGGTWLVKYEIRRPDPAPRHP